MQKKQLELEEQNQRQLDNHMLQMRREIDRNEQLPINLVNVHGSNDSSSEIEGSQWESNSSEQDKSISCTGPDGRVNEVPISIIHKNDEEDRIKLESKRSQTRTSSYEL